MRLKVDIDGIVAASVKIKEATKVNRPLKYFANTQLAKYCEPFVPASQNLMLASKNVQITPEFVRYPGPYAHYQWAGVVYSPNIPIFEGDALVGFFSPPGKPKTKTDRKLKYSRDTHPLAQAHWEEAAMARHKEDLENDIRMYIIKRNRGGNNG